MSRQTPRPLVRYDDYRRFLSDYYEGRKAKAAAFSFRAFADLVGLDSANYPKLVIDGKRNLTVANIHKFAKGLKLAPADAEYFEALVLHNQATTAAERKFYAKRLRALREASPGEGSKLHVRDRMLTDALFPAAILLLNGQERAQAPAQIVARLGLSREIAEHILAFALESGLVAERDGRLHECAEHVVFNSPYTAALQRAFLRRQLQLSLKAFDRDYANGAKFYATTVYCARSAAEDYRERIKSFIDETVGTLSATPAEDLVQLSIQFFKLA